MTRRQYPVGIQTFSRLILDGYVYVDKTDLIWELAHYATFIFLSRPRRFGKSLLTSTLESYFLGDKELFEGLKVMDLEEEWEQYPVLRLDLKIDDIDLALREMQTYLSSLPYVEGFKKKLEDVATAEGFYEYTLYLIFSMLNVYVRTQVKCVQGRTDIVVFMPTAIYVMELKVNGTAQEALDQINSKRYAVPYQTDGRRIIKMGIRFSTETRTIDDWTIDQLDNQ